MKGHLLQSAIRSCHLIFHTSSDRAVVKQTGLCFFDEDSVPHLVVPSNVLLQHLKTSILDSYMLQLAYKDLAHTISPRTNKIRIQYTIIVNQQAEFNSKIVELHYFIIL